MEELVETPLRDVRPQLQILKRILEGLSNDVSSFGNRQRTLIRISRQANKILDTYIRELMAINLAHSHPSAETFNVLMWEIMMLQKAMLPIHESAEFSSTNYRDYLEVIKNDCIDCLKQIEKIDSTVLDEFVETLKDRIQDERLDESLLYGTVFWYYSH